MRNANGRRLFADLRAMEPDKDIGEGAKASTHAAPRTTAVAIDFIFLQQTKARNQMIQIM
jgi:hypothetical protein